MTTGPATSCSARAAAPSSRPRSGVPLIGQVPLVPALREGADEGVPVVAGEPDSVASRTFSSLATAIAGLGPARVYRNELTVR